MVLLDCYLRGSTRKTEHRGKKGTPPLSEGVPYEITLIRLSQVSLDRRRREKVIWEMITEHSCNPLLGSYNSPLALQKLYIPPFKAQVLDSWLAINLASARLQSHPHRACLSSRYTIPSFFHPLLDGENMPSPDLTNPPQSTVNNSSSKHPCRLIPPSLLNFHQSPSKAGCHYTRPMAGYSV